MAAEFAAGGILLSAALHAVSDKLSSPQVLHFFRGRKLDETLLSKLNIKLLSIDVVADDKQFRDPRVKEWLVAVTDAVLDAEDVLDEIQVLSLREVVAKSQTTASKVRNFETKIESRMKQILNDLEDLASKIRSLGLEEASGVGVESGSGSKVSQKLPSTSLLSESVIGRDDDLEMFLDWLTSDTNNRNPPSILVCSIMGMDTDNFYRLESLYVDARLRDLLPKFMFLTFLSLSGCSHLTELPDSIGDLKHLCYLNLSSSGIKIIPKSTLSLQKLRLLIVSRVYLELPSSNKDFNLDTVKLVELQYLQPFHMEKKAMALSKLPPYNLELTGCVCGRQKEKDQVVEFLLDMSDSDDDNTNTNMSMLGIVGPGGIGKTTLAQVVYEDHKVRAWFKLRVWVTFPSYHLDAGTLAKIILQILEVGFDQDDQLPDLMPRLQKRLSERRLLLVLDSCWSVHEWEILRTCFESAARGSVIILTTGTTEAAIRMLADHVLHLSFLSMEHCWSLFSEHCFGNQSLSCSPQLEAVGKRILNKCGGLPLAAKMLGGLLHKKDYKVWEEISRSQQWDSTKVNIPKPFVKLCYLDLPTQLKRCITYLAMFPKGYKLQKRQVVPLWMAKGLIQQGNSETMEELGNEYFDFLVARSFLIRSDCSDNMDFTIHDIVHDFALSESAKFHSVLDGIGESIDTSCLISNKQDVEETPSELYGPQMEEYILAKDNIDIAIRTHGLDQQSLKIEVNIPTTTNDVVQNTFEFGTHFETLRILDASQLVKLPSTLHSLRIEGCHFLESLQDVLMNRSTNLFEIYIIACCSLKYFTDGWYPTSLRTLYVDKCRKLEFLLPLEKMQNFECLEHLFIGSSCDSLKFLPINLFPKLKILCIWDCSNLESLSIDECQNSNLSLESLEIRDCPNLVSFPTKGLLSPNLRSLSVSNCKNLRSLPNYMTTLTSLQSVFVVKCPELESLPAGGLPSCLKLFSIAFCDKLVPQKDWNLQTLHCLHRFEIESGCVGLKSFPEKDLFPINLNSLYISKLQSLEVLDHNGLQQLTALESLEINCCKKLYSLPEVLPSSLTFLCIKESSMLSQKLLNQASADWLKMAHICNIQIDNKVIPRNSTGASFSSRNRIPVSSNTKRTSYHKATVSKFNIKNIPGAL